MTDRAGSADSLRPGVSASKTAQLFLLLKERITSGAFAAGARLPSEPDLAQIHGVSRITVRRALDGLARDGLVRRQPGAGTFVLGRDGPHLILADTSNLLAHIREMGRTTTVRLLSFDYVEPGEAIADALRLEPGERVQRSTRVRHVDGLAFSHLTVHVPERIGATYSQDDLAQQALVDLLERSGVVIHRASQVIGATAAGPDVAAALGVEIGTALMSVTRVVYDQEGRGIEHLAALYRPDRYRFQMELVRAGGGGGGERHWSPIATWPANAGTAPA